MILLADLQVNRLKWYLSEILCDLFCAADVAASTSSIVHLVSISVDSFVFPLLCLCMLEALQAKCAASFLYNFTIVS
uniref:Uncharacterized protein n=1 Tax=Romanomermis culicivorax TaxID=13658 RepID=A0A915JRC7_ROMCU